PSGQHPCRPTHEDPHSSIDRRAKTFPAPCLRRRRSIFDDLDALSAVTRFPRPDLDHERHLEAAARHDRHANREAGDFLGHRGRRPSTLAMIAFRSFGFVTFRMICVLHWLRTFLSTLAARCVITTSPRPNLRPSEASVRNTFEEAAWPT